MNNNKYIFTFIITIMIAIAFVISSKFVNVEAIDSNSESLKKEYYSIEIEAGETLWSIASENFGIGYTDIQDYISDIKAVNGISSDSISSGNKLIIPKYVILN